MNKITPEQEQEIFEHYKAGMKRITIRRLFKITNNQFAQIVRNEVRREENKKNK